MTRTRDISGLPGGLRLDQDVLRLFDLTPNVHFFIKDSRCRLVHCNTIHRHGLLRFQGINGLYGKENHDFFPTALASAFADDDRRVISTGQAIIERIELNITHNGQLSWFCTTKVPARNARGRIVGLIGISRRLVPADARLNDYALLMPAIDHIHANFRSGILNAVLARACGMPLTTFQREFRSLLRMSPSQFVIRLRIHEACLRLASSDAPVAEIGREAGFGDQNYFARMFKRWTGKTPTAYRQECRTANSRKR